ncbi:hypothetical protein GGX14DRAFT_406669 [Mycena pura]|uniref:Uncharacterized protein n=1 Tax=Mycena pura TaxID=153505 RepID=A0AAD6UQA0_9AGAR|nr:hypothetical protein GGX14DRAFT_406669 [Mycena pura]
MYSIVLATLDANPVLCSSCCWGNGGIHTARIYQMVLTQHSSSATHPATDATQCRGVFCARRSATLPFWEVCLRIDPHGSVSLPPTTTTDPTDDDDGQTLWPTNTASLYKVSPGAAVGRGLTTAKTIMPSAYRQLGFTAETQGGARSAFALSAGLGGTAAYFLCPGTLAAFLRSVKVLALFFHSNSINLRPSYACSFRFRMDHWHRDFNSATHEAKFAAQWQLRSVVSTPLEGSRIHTGSNGENPGGGDQTGRRQSGITHRVFTYSVRRVRVWARALGSATERARRRSSVGRYGVEGYMQWDGNRYRVPRGKFRERPNPDQPAATRLQMAPIDFGAPRDEGRVMSSRLQYYSWRAGRMSNAAAAGRRHLLGHLEEKGKPGHGPGRVHKEVDWSW